MLKSSQHERSLLHILSCNSVYPLVSYGLWRHWLAVVTDQWRIVFDASTYRKRPLIDNICRNFNQAGRKKVIFLFLGKEFFKPLRLFNNSLWPKTAYLRLILKI